jgi:hypothetical protein
MALFRFDPISDPRWQDLLQRHPMASVFHTTGWLTALKRTYGFEPVALGKGNTGQPLSAALVFCRMDSHLTGHRIISLPFSDHCQPLTDTTNDFTEILDAFKEEVGGHIPMYGEFRPVTMPVHNDRDLHQGGSFCFHHLDLRPTLAELYANFHKNCVQRKIQRADREGLNYLQGRSTVLLDMFYSLLVETRKRHRLLPQPKEWFQNLVACLGEALTISVAMAEDRPVAGLLTLRFQKTLVYKYACSEKRYSQLGGTQMLLWKAIQEAKELGLTQLDFGRSDWDNPGLLAFKDRWGAERSVLKYWRCGSVPAADAPNWKIAVANGVFSRIARMSDATRPFLGRMLYSHLQ